MGASAILDELLGNLQGILSDGFGDIADFAERQGRMLAQQAELIAEQRIDGALRANDALFHFFLDGMRRDATNMARAIAMLTAITIEKAWNAIANALWGGVRTILTAAGVPAALIPATPPAPVVAA